jgi:hypothetical protein
MDNMLIERLKAFIAWVCRCTPERRVAFIVAPGRAPVLNGAEK